MRQLFVHTISMALPCNDTNTKDKGSSIDYQHCIGLILEGHLRYMHRLASCNTEGKRVAKRSFLAMSSPRESKASAPAMHGLSRATYFQTNTQCCRAILEIKLSSNSVALCGTSQMIERVDTYGISHVPSSC